MRPGSTGSSVALPIVPAKLVLASPFQRRFPGNDVFVLTSQLTCFDHITSSDRAIGSDDASQAAFKFCHCRSFRAIVHVVTEVGHATQGPRGDACEKFKRMRTRMLSIPHDELLKAVARRIVDRHSAPADQAAAESADRGTG